MHKLLFNPNSPNQLAGCCDSTEVKVFDSFNDFLPIYENNAHTDFVRGLAWHKSELVTCSWDNRVLTHKVLCTSSA